MNVTRWCVVLVILVSIGFACTQQIKASATADTKTIETVIRKITGWVKIDEAKHRRLDRFENDEVVCYQATATGTSSQPPPSVDLECIWKDYD